jgi:shikimate dehydrogenase
MRFALIGGEVKHSLSAKLHKIISEGSYEYDLIKVDKTDDLLSVLQNTEYDGFNVTIPYKVEAAKLMDVLSPEAEKIGAVNTVKRLPDGRLAGFNTDIYGFMSMVGDMPARPAMVFGTGGASHAVREGLLQLGATEIISVTRDPAKIFREASAGSGETERTAELVLDTSTVISYDEMWEYAEKARPAVIVNATPVGMYPGNGVSPLDQAAWNGSEEEAPLFPECAELAVDLIYNPYRTKFAQDAEASGVKAVTGLEMLIRQAIKSSEIWRGIEFGEEDEERIAGVARSSLLKNQLNVAVIGMPGCGKTTISRHLARKLRRPFVDIDRKITAREGEKPADIIRTRGEDAFRDIETEVVKEVCRESGFVIATGGGSILRPENRIALRENSIVIYFKRPLEYLSRKGRPLSNSVGIEELYRQRAGIYESTADIILDNSASFSEDSYMKDMNEFVARSKKKIEEFISEMGKDQ